MYQVIGSREVEDSAVGYCCRGMEDSVAVIASRGVEDSVAIKKRCYGML